MRRGQNPSLWGLLKIDVWWIYSVVFVSGVQQIDSGIPCISSILFSIVAVSIYIPTNSVRGLPFSIPSLAFIVYRFFDDGHSDQCEVIPPYSFDLHFSSN